MDAIATPAKQTDDELAAKVIDAMKDVDAATATRNEKAVAAGRLLIEAQKRHPTEKAFEKFLQLAGGIGVRRARDLISFALGRKDFEKHQIENAAAQQRHRDKLKAEKIEREKEKAALPKPDPKPKPKGKGKPKPEPQPEPDPALRNAAAVSARSLQEFEVACELHLPRLNEADLRKASVYFNSGAWKRRAA
jgi:hypothetical protein